MRKTKFNRSRSLQIESLENRELLSVSPLNVGFESQDAALVAEAVYVDAAEAPAAPGNLNVEPGTGRNFVLNWDAVAGATSYEVEVQFGDRAPYKLPYAGNATSYVTPSFPVGEVTFSVYALDADGERSIAAEETGTVIAPTNPANFSAKALPNRQVELTWDAAPGASYYQIYYQNASGDFVNLMQSKTNSCTTTRVAVGDAVFRIATVAPGITPNVATAREAATTIAEPTAPAGINAVALPDGSIELTWNAVPGANYYQAMLVGQNGAEQSLGTTADTTFTTRAFANGEYTLRLYTFSAKVKSDAAEFTVNVAAAPAAPTGLRGTAQTNRVVNLTWNAVANATAYQVYYVNAAGVNELAATVTGPSYGGRMFPSGDNTFFVRALNGDTVSEASDSVIVTNAAPATPQNLKAEQVAGADKNGNPRRDFDLTWDAVAGASSYQISRQVGQGNWVVVKTVSTNSYRTPSFPLNADVNLRVVAIAPRAQSAPATTTVTVKEQTVTPPTAPALSSTATTQTSVALAWATQADLTGYSLNYRASGTADWTAYTGTIAVDATSVTVTGLTTDTSYEFQLTAVNAFGAASSNLLTIRTDADIVIAPGIVDVSAENFKIEQTGPGTFKITFNAVEGADTYTVTNGTGQGNVTKDKLVYTDGGITVTGITLGGSYQIYGVNTAGPGVAATFTMPIPAGLATVSTPSDPMQTAAGTVTFTAEITDASNTLSNLIVRARTNNAGAYEGLPEGTVTYKESATPGTYEFTVTGLTLNNTYTFQVSAVNIAGESDPSTPPSDPVTIFAAPAAPVNVVATKATDSTNITVTWTAVTGAGSYKVEYSTNEGRNWFAVDDQNVTDATATLTGAAAGVYQFRVVTMSQINGTGIASAPALAAGTITISPTEAVPGKPIIDTAASKQTGAGEFTLVWEAVYGADGYDVSSDNGNTWVNAGNVTTFKVTNLTSGSTAFKVQAKNAVGTGAESDALTRTIAPAPAAPTSVTQIQKSPTSVTVTVTLTADASVTDALFYVQTGGAGVYAQAQNVTVTRVSATEYSAEITGLTVGSTYRFAASLKNEAGEGLQAYAPAPMTLVDAPAAVTELTATQSQDTFDVILNWKSSNGATSYKVSYSDGTKWIDATRSGASAASLTQSFVALKPGSYTFRVTPVGVGGDGPATELRHTVVDYLPVATNVTAVQTAAQSVRVNWTAVPGATGYRVMYKVGGGNQERSAIISGGSTTSFVVTDTDFASGNTISIYVAALNLAGQSADPGRNYVTVTLIAAPTIPRLSAEQTAPGTATIKVINHSTAPTNATNYAVYMQTGGTGAFVRQTSNVEVVKDAGGTLTGDIKVTGLSVGQTYRFQVASINVIGETDYSQSVATPAVGPIVAALNAPTGLIVTRAGAAATNFDDLTIKFNAVEGADAYKVYLSDDGGTTWDSGTKTTAATVSVVDGIVTYTAKDLTYSTNWVVRVAAVDTTADGTDIEGNLTAQSTAVAINTGFDATTTQDPADSNIDLKLKAPEILTAEQKGINILLTWREVPGVDTYTLHNGAGITNNGVTDFTAAAGNVVPSNNVTISRDNGIVTATITGIKGTGSFTIGDTFTLNDYFKVVANPNSTVATNSRLTSSDASVISKQVDYTATAAGTISTVEQDTTKVGTVDITMASDVPTGCTVTVYIQKDGAAQTVVPAANVAYTAGTSTGIVVTGLEPGSYRFTVSYTNVAGEGNHVTYGTIVTVIESDKPTGASGAVVLVSDAQNIDFTFKGGASATAAGTYTLYYVDSGAETKTYRAVTDSQQRAITFTVAENDVTARAVLSNFAALIGTATPTGNWTIVAAKSTPATGTALDSFGSATVVVTVPVYSDTYTLSGPQGGLQAAANQNFTITFADNGAASDGIYSVWQRKDGGAWASIGSITVADHDKTGTASINLSSLANAEGVYEFMVSAVTPTNNTGALTLNVYDATPTLTENGTGTNGALAAAADQEINLTFSAPGAVTGTYTLYEGTLSGSVWTWTAVGGATLEVTGTNHPTTGTITADLSGKTAPGVYTYCVASSAPVGAQTTTLTLTVYDSIPALAVTSGGGTLTAASNQEFTLTFSAPGAATGTYTLYEGTETSETYAWTAVGGATLEVTGTNHPTTGTITADLSALTTGAYYYWISATDMTNKTDAQAEAFTLMVD